MMNDLTDTEIVRLVFLLKRCQHTELSTVIHDYNERGIKEVLETVKKIETACKTELGETSET